MEKPQPTQCLKGLDADCLPAALGLQAEQHFKLLGCWIFSEAHLEPWFQLVTLSVEACPFPCLWLASVPQGHLQAGTSLREDRCCLPCTCTQGCAGETAKRNGKILMEVRCKGRKAKEWETIAHIRVKMGCRRVCVLKTSVRAEGRVSAVVAGGN